ncbi:shaker-related potassium channel tsha2-like [Symsagittifera roscoffensis]|uniref:shaker-related potassium channel tsha2-like n=1 Tax=Symsagittifera roscoffensis TaxID=84072 RepID=UPI00307CAC5B
MVKLFQFAVRIMFHVISTGARANKNCRGGGITAADATLEFSPLLRDQSAESCQRFSSQLLDLDRIQDRIRINICGQIFETSMTNIRRYPRTLLGNCYRNEPFFDPIRNELFFDRNREAFDCIFFFYQSGGKLLKPQNMSAEEFLEELTFYEMGDDVIDKYIDTYCRHLKKSRTNDENDCSGPNQASVAPSNRRAVEQISFKSRIWQIFDKPESSVASRIVAGVSVSMIVLSIIVLCVESEFYFVTVSANSSSLSPSSDSSAVVSSNVSLGHQKEIIPVKRRRTHRHSSTLFLVESLAMTWFSIEFITRLFTCPSKVQFMRRILNVFDFLAVLPFYITLFVECDMLADELDNVKARPLSMLRITRLVRIFPILKLTRHSKVGQTSLCVEDNQTGPHIPHSRTHQTLQGRPDLCLC